jgi:hypothetical protein
LVQSSKQWVTEKKRVNLEGEIRRMRLKLDGFVYNPKFGYKVELGFRQEISGQLLLEIVEM